MEFKKPTTAFSIKKCTKLWEEETNKAITYTCKYYYKCLDPICVIYYNHEDAKYQFIQYSEIRHHMPNLIKEKKYKNKELIKSWEKNAFTINVTVNVNKPEFYKSHDNLYINFFKQPNYDKTKKFKDYKKETQDGVMFIWEHIKTILCGDNEDLFKYIHNWIINVVCLKRNKTALYLKSQQGTGKSIISDFLVDQVMPYISHRSEDSKILTEWNSLLVGKVLFVLEELPCVSTGEWIRYSNKLKQLISGDEFTRQEKNEKNFTVKNALNFIFITNNYGIKVDTDDRRYVVLDISNKRKGDFEYFDKLASYTIGNDDVKNAFINYCHENIDEEFDPRKIPNSQTKKDLIIDNLPTPLVYVKECYVLKKHPFNTKFSDVYNHYCDWCNISHNKTMTKIGFSKILEENNIKTKIGHGNIKMCDMSYDELYKLYTQRNWIHDTDEFEDGKGVKMELSDFIETKEEVFKTIIQDAALMEKLKKYIAEQDKPKKAEQDKQKIEEEQIFEVKLKKEKKATKSKDAIFKELFD